jgi:hypothetical protein
MTTLKKYENNLYPLTAKINFDSNDTIVNLLKTNEFTDRHLRILESLISVEAYPKFFGPDLPKGCKFLYLALVSIDDIQDELKNGVDNNLINNKFGAQVARASNNPERDTIHNDIYTNGWKLRCLPIQVKKTFEGKLVPSNGRTRLDWLKKHNIKNAIVAVYQYDTDLSFVTHSIQANCENDPAGNAKAGDVIAAGQALIDNNILKSDIGKNNLFEKINEWVYQATGNGIFTDQKKDEIVISIFNNKQIRPYIYSWTEDNLKKWMSEKGFELASKTYTNVGKKRLSGIYVDSRLETSDEDKNKYIYMTASYSTPSKTVKRAAEVMTVKQFKGKKLRIIVHTSVLSSSTSFKDLKKMYVDRIEGHDALFERNLRNISKVFFKGTEIKTDVELYASFPAIKGEHDLDNFVF